MTRSVIGKRSEDGKPYSLSRTKASETWSACGLESNRSVRSCDGASLRSPIFKGELGIARQELQGPVTADELTPAIPSADESAAEHAAAVAPWVAQQEGSDRAVAVASLRNAVNRLPQKKRCSPEVHSHSGACMPDHNAAGIMIQTIAVRKE